MRRALISIMILGVLCGLMGGYFSLFSDISYSIGNKFQAGVLAFSLEEPSWSGSSNQLGPGDTINLRIQMENTGTLPFAYQVKPFVDGPLADAVIVSAQPGQMEENGVQKIKVTVTLPRDIGGEYEGQSSHLIVNVLGDSGGFSNKETALPQEFSTAKEPPVVKIVSPADGKRLSKSVVIKAHAKDNFFVAKVRFFVDRNLIGVVSADPFEFAWDTTVLPNGPHTITVEAVDGIGQTSSYSIQVDLENH